MAHCLNAATVEDRSDYVFELQTDRAERGVETCTSHGRVAAATSSKSETEVFEFLREPDPVCLDLTQLLLYLGRNGSAHGWVARSGHQFINMSQV